MLQPKTLSRGRLSETYQLSSPQSTVSSLAPIMWWKQKKKKKGGEDEEEEDDYDDDDDDGDEDMYSSLHSWIAAPSSSSYGI
jgi:hypothetical protein